MISFFLKTTKRVNLEKSLRKHLDQNYGLEDMEVLQVEITKCQRLRDQMLENTKDFPKEIQRLEQYYEQIDLISKTFNLPNSKDTASSTWLDSYRENKSATSECIEFEKSCVLFNLAVLHSKRALTRNRSSSEGIKAAIHNFVKAASIFVHLVEKTTKLPSDQKTIDLSQNSLRVMALMMQGQAQICLFEKAQAEKYSIELIAKLAVSVSDIYSKAESNLSQDEALRSWIKKSDYPFHRHITAQKEMFLATGSFWQAKASLHGKKYGEEIAWLKKAESHIKNMESLKTKDLIKSIIESKNKFLDLIYKEMDRAVNDNNSIYHYRIPSEEELQLPEGKCLAKITRFKVEELEKANLKEHIVKLVPISVAKMARNITSSLKDQLEKLMQLSNEQNSEHSERLNDFARFDSAGSADSGGEGVYKELISDIKQIKKQGGMDVLEKSMEELTKTHFQLSSQHKEIVRLLDEQAENERLNRAKFSTYWDLVPCENETSAYRQEAEVIKKYLKDASNSNSKMENKMQKISSSLKFIERHSEKQILTTLPDVFAEFKDSPEMKAIKNLIDSIRRTIEEKNEMLTKRRLELENLSLSREILKLREINDKPEFVKLLEKYQNIHIAPLSSALNDANRKVSQELRELQAKEGEFKKLSDESEAFREKQSVLARLEATIRVHDGLIKGIEAGQAFYKDLKKLYIDLLSAKVQDFLSKRSEQTRTKVDQITNLLENANSGYFGENMAAMNNFNKDFQAMNMGGPYVNPPVYGQLPQQQQQTMYPHPNMRPQQPQGPPAQNYPPQNNGQFYEQRRSHY